MLKIIKSPDEARPGKTKQDQMVPRQGVPWFAVATDYVSSQTNTILFEMTRQVYCLESMLNYVAV